jgi:ribosome-interacting GTPase 1
MPANLTPDYRAAEQRFRAARTLPERIAALQEMLAVIPKHKGTEHMRADLRARLSKLMDELEAPPPGKRGAVSPWSIRKEGAGRAVLVGPPNAGKSALLARLTGAAARVGAYPFTTELPLPGTLKVGGARIQTIDTPPITERHAEPALFGLLRTADVIVPVLDLTAEPAAALTWLRGELQHRRLALTGPDGPAPPEDMTPKPAVIAATKADLPGALDALPALAAAATGLPVVPVSVIEDFGLEDLGEAVFRALGVIRVFTKAPGQEPDRDDPVVLPEGSTVLDFAEALHRGWEKRLRYAVLWGGSGKFAGQRVGKDHVLADGDAVELHG